MKELIENFCEQLDEALAIANASRFHAHPYPLHNVVISGLGGSGIGGTIAAQLAESTATTPVVVNKKYHLPAFVNRNSLVIISSYSGNTEETISALHQAVIREAKVVCITSGGEIEKVARAASLDLVLVPSGMPPRACLGYSLVQLLNIFSFFGITGHDFLKEVKETIPFLKAEQKTVEAEAKLLAEKLTGKIPVIYTADDFEGIAIRFRQQLNENAKMLGWHHVFPELNHNELVGWRNENHDIAVVLFRNASDFERTSLRMNISLDVFKKYTPHVFEVQSKGRNNLERSLYLIHLGDWISWFLAQLNQVDATEVKIIDHLKSELAKV